MNKFSLALAGILLVATTGIATASSEEEYEEKCKAWAQEDQIGEDKMEEYIQDCIKQLKDEEAAAASDK